MKLDTFESTTVTGMFVTMPSASARVTLGLIDGLAELELDPYRRGYRLTGATLQGAFARSVFTQIVDQGYALHRMNPAFGGAGSDLSAGPALREGR